jgi:hypothetical protein
MTGTGPRASLTFAAWTIVGAGAVLGLLTILTIGIFVLPATTLLAVLLAWRGQTTQAVPGVVTGLGLIPVYVAYLNRGGPGTVCTTTALSQSCAQEMNPWPWLAAGLCLAGAGAVLSVMLRRSGRVARR